VDNGFAMRACTVVDLSATGVQITLDASEKIPSEFTFVISKTAGPGRRARVKWRRGSRVGAEFL
jgi:hypothetical protein